MKPPTGKPCGECPFRRASAAGWLGNDDPQHFAAVAMSEMEMPCHAGIDYERKDWRKQAAKAHQCSGRAIFLANQCKLPMPGSPVKLLPADREKVFTFRQEFLAHHEAGAIRRG